MKILLQGVAPLLMNNPQTINPDNEFTKLIKPIARKKTKKTEEDEKTLRKLEFMARLYWDDSAGPVLPTYNFIQCLREAARITKQGKNIERGVRLKQQFSKLEYEGPRTREELFDKGYYDIRNVRNSGSGGSIMRIRPCFKDWKATFQINYLDSIISKNEIIEIAKLSGQIAGLGDFRQQFGKFDVVGIED